MLRLVAILLVAIVLISLLKSVLGLIARGIADLAKGPKVPENRQPQVPEGGELKKDPVCGTYVSTASRYSKDGVYFCSAECRDRYQA